MDMNEAPHLLLVDDERSIREPLAQYLTKQGFRVTQVGEAQSARDRLNAYAIDLVILDIMMPGMHGVQVLRLLKQVKPTIKVIMITAVDDEDIAREAMKEGALDYVTKPLDLNYLDAQVTFNLAL